MDEKQDCCPNDVAAEGLRLRELTTNGDARKPENLEYTMFACNRWPDLCAQLAAAIRERDDYKLRAEQAEWIAVVQMTDEYSRDRFSEIYEPLARAIARDNTPPCFDAARLAVLDYLAEYAINHLADAQAEESR